MGIYTKVDVRVVRLNVNRKCDKSGDDLRREVQHVVDVCEFRGYKAKHHREYTPAPRARACTAGANKQVPVTFYHMRANKQYFRKLISGDPGYVRTPRVTGNSADLLLQVVTSRDMRRNQEVPTVIVKSY